MFIQQTTTQKTTPSPHSREINLYGCLLHISEYVYAVCLIKLTIRYFFLFNKNNLKEINLYGCLLHISDICCICIPA